MRKILCMAASLIMVLSLCLIVFTGRALATPSNCGTQAFTNQISIATGSTPASIKLAVWKACDGGYYAAAYASADNNGFRFHGSLQINVNEPGGIYYSSNSVYCNGSAACDGQEVYPAHGSSIWGEFTTNNGQFYYCNPTYNLYGHYSFITSLVNVS